MVGGVGINGFGRIGRQVVRQFVGRDDVQVRAVNGLWDLETFMHILRRDSNYGEFPASVEMAENGLRVDGREIIFTHERDPVNIPWEDMGVDVVVEATGVFRDRDKAGEHISGGGAKKVIITAPADDPDLTVVLGVNEDSYDRTEHHIISSASCTTTCLAPVVRVLDESFGIESGLINTIHAYTRDQSLLDGPHKDLRRARAAAVNMIPTTTGAARAVGEVIPHLEGKLNGFAVRVPTTTVSLLDLTVQVREVVTPDCVNEAMQSAADGSLAGILQVSDEPLVSVDFMGDTHSAVVDLPFTSTSGEHMAKVLAWYDNEMGYAARVADLVHLLIKEGV